MKTVAEVDALAAAAHVGQVDKVGVPYIEHVRAVAAGLAPFGDHLVMAGLLHDVIEDTDWTAEQLREAGVPDRVVCAVEAVTNQQGVPYEVKVRRIALNRDATLVKIADNAHNSRPDRSASCRKISALAWPPSIGARVTCCGRRLVRSMSPPSSTSSTRRCSTNPESGRPPGAPHDRRLGGLPPGPARRR